MTAPLTCPACAASFTAAADPRGKKTVCPRCGQRLVVTSAGVAKRDEGRAGVATAPGRFPWLWLAAALLAMLAAGGVGVGILVAASWPGWHRGEQSAAPSEQPAPADIGNSPHRDLADNGTAPPDMKPEVIPPEKPKPDKPRPVAQLLDTFQLPVVDQVNCLAFSRDGKTLAAGGMKAIYVFDVAGGQCKFTLKAPDGEDLAAYSVAFSPTDDNLLASGCCSWAKYTGLGPVMLWDVSSGKNTATFDAGGLIGGFLCVAFSPDGKTLATGTYDAKLWDVATGRNTATLARPPKPSVTSLAFSPDGKTVALVSNQKTILFWDVATGKSTAVLESESNPGFGYLAFSPDGKTLAVTDRGAVKLWTVGSGKETRTVAAAGMSPTFSPDGKLLAIPGYANKTVTLYDVAGGKNLATLEHPAPVSAAAFSRDGKTLASGDTDKTIKLWRINSDAVSDRSRDAPAPRER
jgi:WD40 repeat protein